jgi:hypothetical protein
MWLDEPFSQFGAVHRKERHHKEGIAQAGVIFGEGGAQAATIHVLRDCLHIPSRADYLEHKVDPLGYPIGMPVAEIATYDEERFRKLVQQNLNPEEFRDLFVWGWLDSEDEVLSVLRAITGSRDVGLDSFSNLFAEAQDLKQRLSFAHPASPFRPADETFEEIVNKNFPDILTRLGTVHQQVNFGYVAVDSLINPLQLIDSAFVDHLTSELNLLQGERDVVNFAFPTQVSVKVKAVADNHSATVITRFQQFSLVDVRSEIVPGVGIDVRFNLRPIPQLIIVGHFEGRFYLKAGIHRAFVLAKAGLREIPCLLVSEEEIPTIAGPYPAYSAGALRQVRPPLLIDALEERLTMRVQYERANRVLRISAEEFVVPID